MAPLVFFHVVYYISWRLVNSFSVIMVGVLHFTCGLYYITFMKKNMQGLISTLILETFLYLELFHQFLFRCMFIIFFTYVNFLEF